MQCWLVYMISLKKKHILLLGLLSIVIVDLLMIVRHSSNSVILCGTPVLLTAGIILGFGLRRYNMSYRDVTFFSFPGELLMRMLQMLVLPLLVSSLITGTAVLFLCERIINVFLKLTVQNNARH